MLIQIMLLHLTYKKTLERQRKTCNYNHLANLILACSILSGKPKLPTKTRDQIPKPEMPISQPALNNYPTRVSRLMLLRQLAGVGRRPQQS